MSSTSWKRRGGFTAGMAALPLLATGVSFAGYYTTAYWTAESTGHAGFVQVTK